MQKRTMLETALRLAMEAHEGQFDKGGHPYILHPMKVMHYLKSDDEELQCIALLHDVVEDNKKFTFKRLREEGMSDRVITGVRALTKMPGETHDEYKQRVISNKDSIKVKKCDLRHNSDIRRLKGITEKDIARTAGYHIFYVELDALDK